MTDQDRTDAGVRRWIEGYLAAWSSNEPAAIRALFTADAQYRTEPWTDPWTGADQIVSSWLDRADTPGSYTFEWRTAGIDGSRAFVQAETRYEDGRTYSNLWVIDLAEDGRARAFTEWWMDQSLPS